MKKSYQDRDDQREIPVKKNPSKNYPEKSPDTEPNKDNPRDPQSDELNCDTLKICLGLPSIQLSHLRSCYVEKIWNGFSK